MMLESQNASLERTIDIKGLTQKNTTYLTTQSVCKVALFIYFPIKFIVAPNSKVFDNTFCMQSDFIGHLFSDQIYCSP